MILDGRVEGLPLVEYNATRSSIEGITTGSLGMIAVASDLSSLGWYDGVRWLWFTSVLTSLTSTAVDLTLSEIHHRVLVTVTGKTITLPTAVGITGREYSIKAAAGVIITIATTSGQTIDGDTSLTVNGNENVVVFSDGSNWRIG